MKNKFAQYKKAFTLSEVLITLVVIGVVAAITIPSLTSLWQKEVLKTAFIKTYSDLNNFSKKFYFDYYYSIGEYAYVYSYDKTINKMKNYYNIIGVASNATYSMTEDDSSYSLRLLSGKKLDTGLSLGKRTLCDNSAQFADIAGRLYRFNDAGTQYKQGTEINGPIICVDTNGLKGPNKYGYDYFLFIFTVDGRVIPMGMEDKYNTSDTDMSNNFFVTGSNYCSKSATSVLYNAACAYYALTDKHPNNPNKSYWRDFL